VSEGFADKSAFFGGFQRRYKEVDCPLGKVLIGNLSEGEHQQLEKEIERNQKKKTEHIVRLVYLKWGCWTPDKSARLFTDADIKKLVDEDIDYAIVRSLVNEIVEHIGTTNQDIEALAKN
jgi:hypothetical protein